MKNPLDNKAKGQPNSQAPSDDLEAFEQRSAAPADGKQSADTGVLSAEQILTLQRELEQARAEREVLANQLAESERREKQANAAAQTAALIMSNQTEVPAGETEEPWYNPKTKREEMRKTQMWRYRIDLAPNGGSDININGMRYYHGMEYTFTTAQLQSVKDMVYRTHVHEASIKGSDENFYRQPTNRVLQGTDRRH